MSSRSAPFVLLPLASLLLAGDSEPLVMPPMPGQPDPQAAAALGRPEVAWEAGDRIIYVGDLLAYPRQAPVAIRLHDELAASRKGLDIVVRQLANHGLPAERWRTALTAEFGRRGSAQVVIINVGLGDAYAANAAKATTIPGREAYRTTVQEMVKAAQAAGAAVVLCTPPVFGDKPFGGPFTAELDGYAEVIRELATSLGCELAELRQPQMELLTARNAKATRDLNIVSRALGQFRPEAVDAMTAVISQAVSSAVRRIPWSVRLAGGPFTGTTQVELRSRGIAPERVELRYTTDGSEPTAASRLYSRPFPLSQTAQVRVLATARDGSGTRTASAWYTATLPRRAPEPPKGELLPGLWVDHFTLRTWVNPIPNLGSMQPGFTTTWRNFELDAISRVPVHRYPNHYFALRFTGWFTAPYDGVYRFATHSDDASRLYFADQLVVRNDDLHPMRWAHGSIELSRGLHPVTLWYGQGPGGSGLELYVALPGERLQLVPDMLLRRTAAPPERRQITFEFAGAGGAAANDLGGEPEAPPGLDAEE